MKTLLSITCLICISSLAAPTCLKVRQQISEITQSPKQIIAHPGQSVTISCVVTSTKATITGVHLRKHFTKILYVNSMNGVSIYNDKRITVSGKVANFNVTIRDLNENDAATYLCDGVTSDDQDLCGDGTVVAVDSRIKPQSHNDEASKRRLDSQHGDKWQTGIRQPPTRIFAKTGDSVSFTCSITSKQKIRRVWLQKETTHLVLCNNSNGIEIKRDYKDRLNLYGTFSDFTVTLKNVSDADADFYSCKGDTEDEEDEDVIFSNGTMVVIDACSADKESDATVQHAKSAQPQDPFTVLVCVVVVLTVVLLFVVACFMNYCYTKKKFQIPRNARNTVYEEMTRRDTMNSNCYSNV